MTFVDSSEITFPTPHLALETNPESRALGSEQATDAEAILEAELAALSLEDHERILFDGKLLAYIRFAKFVLAATHCSFAFVTTLL